MFANRLALPARHAETAVLVLVLGVTLAFMTALTAGKLLRLESLEAMAFQIPLLGVLALAQMLPMLTGGIDLAVISTANLTGISTALILTRLPAPYATPLGIVVGLGGALVVGTANGVLAAMLGVSPLIGTLATMILVRGVALAITRGYVIAGFPQDFLFLGGGSLAGLPMPFVIFGLAAAAMAVLLNRTPFGVSEYMLGSNPVATLFSGVNTRALLLKTYLISGLLAGIAGLIMISRFNAAQADYGAGFLLLTVLIAVLGGVDPAGGVGTVLGLVIAVVILQLVATGFNLVGLSQHLANALWGVILILVIIFRRALPRTGPGRS
ncbi:MAG: ABC transporter permease [Armatimonadota bacterium]|nr:ABC transporter permease [Armatimonadota bacterium]MDR7427930.1 ABC transporter permease [Armatimonadota bacterium]MDR7465211.1 ABC transporter permease [Armatimonadota bacterium]MDR7470578.1 ABC transporter permease [Armatimonadota bacterium]MDR7538837.1 ABC transporter permease [Armatimonadota bacterium]